MRKTKLKKIALLMIPALLCSFLMEKQNIPLSKAVSQGTIVINEIAWAGSADSSNDEWIELYNTSNQPVDLSNWYIKDDQGAATYTIQSGTIPANGYFLIEDHESAVNNITSDAVIGVSLSNTGDSLELFDNNNQLIDAVNTSSGSWAAGSATTKATMERINPLASGNDNANFASSTGNGAVASGNSNIIGTPRNVNSTFGSGGNQNQNTQVTMALSSANVQIGNTLTVQLNVQNASNLFAYGFDINYDQNILHFVSANKDNFLSENGNTLTSFQADLENNLEGKIVVAEARTLTNKTGVNGSGTLATLQFQVVGSSSSPSNITFGANSFLSHPSGDITAQFQSNTVNAQAALTPVSNLQITEGNDRYSLSLSWNQASGATTYKVYRKNAHDAWMLVQESPATTFIDKDNVTNGGFIVPNHQYNYRIIAVNGTNESTAVDGNQQDTRGLKGDNNRNDRVDGRDLEQLAKHFGEIDTDNGFNPLIDTTYDGIINGSDLIDIGANFALTYTP